MLVAYDLPYRDCGQYSAGGALSTADYAAWIEAFAAGIGNRPAVVILEPDGLGLIPNYASELDGSQSCVVDGPEATPEARFAQLNHAVDVLGALPHTAVYLDATHSSWQNVSESAFRLLKAGVQRADGFFLNASNYEYTTNQVFYGTWISQCIETAVTSPGWSGEPVAADFPDCANQYWNGGPEGTAIADLLGPWTGVALSSYGEWSEDATDPALNVSGINARYSVAGHDALRDRHQPQRPGTVGLGGRRVPRRRYRAELVQPAGPGPGPAADDRHGRPAGRRLPVDQGPRRVRRPVHPRRVGRGRWTRSAAWWTPLRASGSAQQARELISLAEPPMWPWHRAHR